MSTLQHTEHTDTQTHRHTHGHTHTHTHTYTHTHIHVHTHAHTHTRTHTHTHTHIHVHTHAHTHTHTTTETYTTAPHPPPLSYPRLVTVGRARLSGYPNAKPAVSAVAMTVRPPALPSAVCKTNRTHPQPPAPPGRLQKENEEAFKTKRDFCLFFPSSRERERLFRRVLWCGKVVSIRLSTG